MDSQVDQERSLALPQADEILWGAEAIGAAVNLNARQAFHLLSTGRLPGLKIGNRWSISRRALQRLWNSEGDPNAAAH